MNTTRRHFLKAMGGALGALAVESCLDTSVSPIGTPNPEGTPPVQNTELADVCAQDSQLALSDLSIAVHPWPRGLDAGALIDVDDLCPVSIPGEGLDFGGDLSENGLLRGFLIDQLAASYPEAKVSLMTIANMRQNPITQTAVAEDDRYLLSAQPNWSAAILEILAAHPNFRLAMHGFWHFDYVHKGATEFSQYSDLESRAVMGRMHREFRAVFPMAEPVFRAPGWATNGGVLQYLSDAGLLLSDCSNDPTFRGSAPSCDNIRPGVNVVRAGPDFTSWIPQGAQNAGLIVGHFHFTAPNENSIGTAAGQRTALGFARAIRGTTQYKIDWFSYYEAARSVAIARSVKWAAALDGNTLVLTVNAAPNPLRGVTFAVTNLGGRDIYVKTRLNDPILFSVRHSARGCDYIVLSP